MTKQKQQEQVQRLSFGTVLVGTFVGALAGALAMLLMAPQSGKKTRSKIEQKSKEMSQQAVHTIESGVDKAQTKANEVSAKLYKQVDDLQQRGHEAVEQQKERWTPVLDAGKTAVNNSSIPVPSPQHL